MPIKPWQDDSPDTEEQIGKVAPDLLRRDGTMKGSGYFGPITLPDGSHATEYTVGTSDVTGQEMDIPTLVPTLTRQEFDSMVKDVIPNRAPIPDSIIRKAVDFAKGRLNDGKSVFFDPNTDNVASIQDTSYEEPEIPNYDDEYEDEIEDEDDLDDPEDEDDDDDDFLDDDEVDEEEIDPEDDDVFEDDDTDDDTDYEE